LIATTESKFELLALFLEMDSPEIEVEEQDEDESYSSNFKKDKPVLALVSIWKSGLNDRSVGTMEYQKMNIIPRLKRSRRLKCFISIIPRWKDLASLRVSYKTLFCKEDHQYSKTG
jgi:hypothetical protein